MRLNIETRADAMPGLGTANVVLGLFALAEALRLSAQGDAYRVVHKAEREFGWPFGWRLRIAPLEYPTFSIRRTPASDLLIASITSGPLTSDVAILTSIRVGSLEAEIEKLWERIRRSFQSIVVSAAETAATNINAETVSESNSQLSQVVRQSVEEITEEINGNRAAAIIVTTAATAWMRDGLTQVGARSASFGE